MRGTLDNPEPFIRLDPRGFAARGRFNGGECSVEIVNAQGRVVARRTFRGADTLSFTFDAIQAEITNALAEERAEGVGA